MEIIQRLNPTLVRVWRSKAASKQTGAGWSFPESQWPPGWRTRTSSMVVLILSGILEKAKWLAGKDRLWKEGHSLLDYWKLFTRVAVYQMCVDPLSKKLSAEDFTLYFSEWLSPCLDSSHSGGLTVTAVLCINPCTAQVQVRQGDLNDFPLTIHLCFIPGTRPSD